MGIQQKGAFGGFVNKTGNLVGRNINGQNVISSVPKKSSKPATDKQLNQRKRFGLVTNFLAQLRTLIKEGYQENSRTQTPMNKAVQYNLRNAVTGTGPDYQINFPFLRFTLGKCSLPDALSASAETGAKIAFAWGMSILDVYSKATDKVNLVVYSVAKKKAVILYQAASRSELGFSMQLPANFVSDEVHCYLSLIAEDGKESSNTEYLGEFTVIG